MPQMTPRGQRPPLATPLVKNPQNEPPRSKTPRIYPRGQNPQIYPLDQKSLKWPPVVKDPIPQQLGDKAYCMVCGWFSAIIR